MKVVSAFGHTGRRFRVLFVIAVGLGLGLSSCVSKKKKPTPPPEPKKEMTQEAPMAPTTPHPHWSYEGIFGPDLWGSLSPDYEMCKSGQSQSPVDLVWKRPEKGGEIQFNYTNTPLRLIDNGHTILLTVDPGSTALIRGEAYDLKQVHFHSTSEHTLSSKSFPMEIHLVHEDNTGRLAIVGILVEEGSKNAFIETLWAHIPTEKYKEGQPAGFVIDPKNILPSRKTYYHYSGSLTTPPCTEGVNWNVLNTPIELSRDQIDAFRILYPNNNRPVQPLNGRTLTNY